jgi:three-Cys-motif partner protein
MAQQSFGGNWTEEKLERVSKYLPAWRRIFTSNPRARHFKTWYVDAFAGTGSRAEPERAGEGSLFCDIYLDEEATRFRAGSAKIALGLSAPFDSYLFIEKAKIRVSELKGAIERDHPTLLERCNFQLGDANQRLKMWCQQRDWNKERAVVFLDPYGMQVEWSTIEALAKTKGIDLWYLFPLVARMLKRDGKITESWQKRLDLLFGTADWRARFYQPQKNYDLFGDRETIERDASVMNIKGFIEERLATCFPAVAPNGLVLRNSKASPLYLLCFAAANEKGAPTALKIAQDILKG